jgi:hypothetical protein
MNIDADGLGGAGLEHWSEGVGAGRFIVVCGDRFQLPASSESESESEGSESEERPAPLGVTLQSELE